MSKCHNGNSLDGPCLECDIEVLDTMYDKVEAERDQLRAENTLLRASAESVVTRFKDFQKHKFNPLDWMMFMEALEDLKRALAEKTPQGAPTTGSGT